MAYEELIEKTLDDAAQVYLMGLETDDPQDAFIRAAEHTERLLASAQIAIDEDIEDRLRARVFVRRMSLNPATMSKASLAKRESFMAGFIRGLADDIEFDRACQSHGAVDGSEVAQ